MTSHALQNTSQLFPGDTVLHALLVSSLVVLVSTSARAQTGGESRPADATSGAVEAPVATEPSDASPSAGSAPSSEADGVVATGGIAEAEVPEEAIDETAEAEEEAHGLGRVSHTGDPDAVFRVFSLYAKDQRNRRIAGSLGGVLAGGTTIGIGAILETTVDADPRPWFIVGGVVAGLSALGLFMPSPAERMAHHHHAHRPGHSPEEAAAFEDKWADAAHEAKNGRMVSGVINLLLGGGAVGAGVAIATGAGEMSDNSRAAWGGVLIGLGAGFVGSGVGSFLIKSSIETSYEQYSAGQQMSAGGRFDVGLSGAADGFGLSMQGSF